MGQNFVLIELLIFHFVVVRETSSDLGARREAVYGRVKKNCYDAEGGTPSSVMVEDFSTASFIL